MSATATRSLEGSLTSLNKQIGELKSEYGGAKMALDDATDSLAAKGVKNGSPEFVATLKPLHEKAEAARTKLEALERDRDRTAEQHQLADSTGLHLAGRRYSDGAVLGAAPWTLDRHGLDGLIEAAQHGKMARAGVQASVGWSDPVSIDRSSIVDLIAQEPTRIADYIPSLVTESSRVEFTRQTARADQAAAVAAGAPKPQSSPAFERTSVDVTKIAHWGEIEDEILKDEKRARDIIGTAFILGLISEENRQLLVGDGSGEDMVGLLNTPDILVVTRDLTTPQPRLEAIHRAITRIRNIGYGDATLIILHPNDYEETLFEKASGSGEYLAGNPTGQDTPTLWNKPVALTTDMPEGTGLVANLPGAARMHWREAPYFEVHPAGGGQTQWVNNTTLVRSEERAVLSVHHPALVCAVEQL